MTDILVWPHTVLKPARIDPQKVPFSRSGGRTLTGVERSTKTDYGYWRCGFRGLTLDTPAKRRQFGAISVHCGGMGGLLAIPFWSYDTAEWPAGTVDGRIRTTHSDGSHHSDGSGYSQPAILVEMAAAAEIGDTEVTLRAVWNIEELAGIRFSYNHALYETGFPTLVDGDEWTVPIFPAIRAAIPADAELEVAMPTCLVTLATDREMDAALQASGIDQFDIDFVEAVDYWTDLALS